MNFQLDRENDPLILRLENSVKNERVSHAYLIEGPSFTDKPAFARSFAKGILCPKGLGENCGACPICDKIDHGNHEDLIYVSRQSGKQTIAIKQIREMQAQVGIKPGGERYIVIIDESEAMTEDAQNCLLKTLEEPPGKTVLLLLTENSQRLLPTIRSRCVKIRLEGEGQAADEQLAEKAEQLLDQFLGRSGYYRMRKTLGDAGKDARQALDLIDLMERRCRERVLSRDENGVPYSPEEVSRCAFGLEKAREQISRGMTPGYVLKRFLLSREDRNG